MTVKGTIHGSRIELEHPTGLPDGAKVMLDVRSADEEPLPGFGSWADDDADVDAFVRETRERRQADVQRAEP